ncbi:hypothetical protein EC9_13650 [Rosistilla ulvae]|uniref:Uncharacterized protein n=1 Tax=Rosistilla ulvae TaxID=1930277 RepID=A0A517LX41_9BACT|nr:hypothetical protein EC9_13650 [Rosistilla ulvae]
MKVIVSTQVIARMLLAERKDGWLINLRIQRQRSDCSLISFVFALGMTFGYSDKDPWPFRFSAGAVRTPYL